MAVPFWTGLTNLDEVLPRIDTDFHEFVNYTLSESVKHLHDLLSKSRTVLVSVAEFFSENRKGV